MPKGSRLNRKARGKAKSKARVSPRAAKARARSGRVAPVRPPEAGSVFEVVPEFAVAPVPAAARARRVDDQVSRAAPARPLDVVEAVETSATSASPSLGPRDDGPRAREVVEAAREANVLTLKVERERDRWIKPDLFWVFLVDESVSPEAVLKALGSLADGAAATPREVLAWCAKVEHLNAVFFFSVPAPGTWLTRARVGAQLGLPRYMLVEHIGGEPLADAFLERGPEGVRERSAERDDFAAVDDRSVWTLLERRAGVSLERLQQAMPFGRAAFVVHRAERVVPLP